MRLLARAKVNLGLRVIGRRPDGYHRIATVFQEIDLADRIDLRASKRSGIRLTVRGRFARGVPRGRKNLAWRAAEMMLRGRRGWKAPPIQGEGVQIVLTKNIPVAGGVGGGSSDAAAVLRGMAKLLGRGQAPPLRATRPGSSPGSAYEVRGIREMARKLGADVPFFLLGGRARATGIGDRLVRLRRAPGLRFALVNPGVPLSTAAVYREWDRHGAGLTPPANLGRMPFTNDLAPDAERLCPAIGRVRDALTRAGCGAVFLCGSGPTVAGVLPREAIGRTVVRAIRREGGRAGEGWWIRVASSA